MSNGAAWTTAVVHWWAGDGIGVLVVGAPILLWPRQSHKLRARLPETAAVLGVTAVLSLTALWWQAPLALPLLPVMAWAALRLDVIGAALAGAVVAFTVNYMTGSGRGAFKELDLAEPVRLAVTQVFIAVMVLVAMVIAQEAAGRVAAVRARRSRTPRARPAADPGTTGTAAFGRADAEPDRRRGRQTAVQRCGCTSGGAWPGNT